MRATEDPAQRAQFYKVLAESDLFVVQHGEVPESSGVAVMPEGFELRIGAVELDGRPCIPVFSSLTHLQASLDEEAGYLAINAMELMTLIEGDEMVLNPGMDYGKVFSREELKSILDGSIWQAPESYCVEQDTQVMLGQPTNYPHSLADTLARLFKNLKEVKRAYLAHFFNPEMDEKPHTLVGIEVSNNWEHVVAQAGLVAQEVEVPDPPVDFIQLTGLGGVEDYFLHECAPFYKKKFLGLF